MPDWSTIMRWVHVGAGAAWFGEVVTVVFVLVPLIGRMEVGRREEFIASVFPRVFRLASVLAGTTLLAGLALNYLLTGWSNMGDYFASQRGAAILAGGLLGGLLAGFHFLVEARIEGRVASLMESENAEGRAKIEGMLQTVPKAGLGVITVIVLLMMVGARGV